MICNAGQDVTETARRGAETQRHYRELNAGDLFRRHRFTAREAIVDLSKPGGPRILTYRDLDDRCNGLARGLRHLGVQRGDRVAILSSNRAEYIEVLFGAMRAACIPVPVNVKLPKDLVNHIICDSGARLIFCEDEFREKCPAGIPVVSFDDQSPPGYEEMLDFGPFESVRPERRTVAVQPYTSGSTGTPKGILLGHEGVCWVTQTAVRVRGLDHDTRSLVAAPLFHKNATQTTKQTLACGGTVVLMERFKARAYIEAIEAFRVTQLSGVPTMFQLMLREKDLLDSKDLSTVRRIGFGSAPGSDALYDELTRRFPQATVENHYGITEGGPIMFGPHPAGLPRPRNSVGYVLDGANVRLEGGETPEEGVLLVKSPGVMLGYHNLPELTAQKLKDGWLDTGDILRRGKHGFYFFVGRVDDMFVCGGENIYPVEVESLLERHPDIQQAVVVPVEDELKAFVPYAFVVARPGSQLTEAQAKDHALRHGPAYAHPRRVFFLPEIPLAGTGKIDRKTLVDKARTASQSANHRAQAVHMTPAAGAHAGEVTGLDHVAVVSARPEEMFTTYERMGFRLTPVSRHSGATGPGGEVVVWGTGNRCAMFRSGYLELLAIFDPAMFCGPFPKLVESREGIHIVALASADAHSAWQRLKDAGVQVAGIVPLKRQVEMGGTEHEAKFSLVRLADGEAPEVRLNFLQHHTPEVMWQERYLDHPNGALSLADVMICVGDIAEAEARYRRLLGREPVARGPVRRFELPSGALSLVAADDLPRLLPDISIPALPFVASFTVKVSDLKALSQRLDEAGFSPDRHDGRLIVRPEAAFGAACIFEAQDQVPA